MDSIIKRLSRYLAREGNFAQIAGNNGEVFTYALTLLAVNMTALGAIALLAWLLDTLKATIFICLAFYSLRIFTGGRHQSGPVKCWLLTVFILTTLGYLATTLAPRAAHYMNLITALGLVLALFAAITRAPVTIASKKFTTEKRRKLKMAAVAVIIFWATLVLIPASTMITADPVIVLAIITGLVTQSISILPPGSRDRGCNE
jgi:accessory gene regulator protein AgrB